MDMYSIIDNRDGNTLLRELHRMSQASDELRIATAFFSLDALMMAGDTLEAFQQVRILFGDDASASQRLRLLQLLRTRSDADLLAQRADWPNLSPLNRVKALFMAGCIQARCYTAKKFHAKAYLVHRAGIYPERLGVLGSGNFTRAGLTQNIELNCIQTTEQVHQLHEWFEARWLEAQDDDVTEDVLAEIKRQIDLYQPWYIYLKALSVWGAEQEADTRADERTKLLDALDPHQEQGLRRALKIVERESGVMICDGVGLGKSFIALGLMEHYCARGANVLLIAPKHVLISSWDGYLDTWLKRYRRPFGSICELSMTDLGFNASGTRQGQPVPRQTESQGLVNQLFERADVVVIDESHNFRRTSAARYGNLRGIMRAYQGRRKKCILLTATPINTAYSDLGSQLALIAQENGTLAGFRIQQVTKFASELDRGGAAAAAPGGQLSLALKTTSSESLNRVLSSVVIQRSRATCKALAHAQGKAVHFPQRIGPECISVQIGTESAAYKALIALAHRRFRPGVEFVQQMRSALADAEKSGDYVRPVEPGAQKLPGIKLAAYLIEQYRRVPADSRRAYVDEVHLASLVFTNALKQLESSPAAFQGILQGIGRGLLARLHQVLGPGALSLVQQHRHWIRTDLFTQQETPAADEDADLGDGGSEPINSAQLEGAAYDEDLELDDGDAVDDSGDESDAWLQQAIRSRKLARKLDGFTAELFDVERWKADIAADLGFLREIHGAVIRARRQPDPKLACLAPRIKQLLDAGRRVLVFTQSQRTAEYLQLMLAEHLREYTVGRIDSTNLTTRAAILYAFCPGYNEEAEAPSVPKRVDLLVCTDVLSEGVNLQQAGAVISYDIHWNPVRLIQRIGRCDRRLNPEITPPGHSIEIINVLPPPEINNILKLVATVEQRTIKISSTLGLDESFFQATDPGGTLKEFNAEYEGDVPLAEEALTEFARLSPETLDAAVQATVDALPDGAFGVWAQAPCNGLFVLFTMQPLPTAPQADRDRFAAIIGKPVLALEREGRNTSFDAGEILKMLSFTTPHEPSGTPSDEPALAARLKKLTNQVRNQFGDVGLPTSILPRLVCWMELKGPVQ